MNSSIVMGFRVPAARLVAALGLLFLACLAPRAEAQSVRVTTNMGEFVVELQQERAPLTVANFLRYVNEGFYTNTLFHRVVGNFVVQGGGYSSPDFKLKPTHETIVNESGNGLQNKRGTLGMARSGPPHSGNSQFYINLADNPELDPLPTRWGYTVFGKVVEGMDVIDKIGVIATGSMGPFKSEAPLKPVVIEKVELVKAAGSAPDATVNPAIMPSSEGAPGSASQPGASPSAPGSGEVSPAATDPGAATPGAVTPSPSKPATANPSGTNPPAAPPAGAPPPK